MLPSRNGSQEGFSAEEITGAQKIDATFSACSDFRWAGSSLKICVGGVCIARPLAVVVDVLGDSNLNASGVYGGATDLFATERVFDHSLGAILVQFPFTPSDCIHV